MDKIIRHIINLQKEKKYKESIDILDNLIKNEWLSFDYSLLMFLLRANSHFELGNWEKSRDDYQFYINTELLRIVPEEIIFSTENEHNLSILIRKMSRCIYICDGLDCASDYLLKSYHVFKHPRIFLQLAIFLREAGRKDDAAFYEKKAHEVWRESGFETNLFK